ncbi:Crp/Fnr family transcriptional regulator [Bradyrhizobium sp. 157]|uniref:Crp/Fnr family transcriptional regulator n=1 Tax=Bradyrhizobium sp. 157 TaxID=2782631 RepID=UPI001FF75337|nr:Crp/Fnr family transcriptional regulator [Bradyrhizobium sp. 157]MCK1640863.1 Crp/Fnr family transcriptional regulator [Bradyrhizobium sp. 157]
MPHSKNRILSRASPVDLEDLRPHLRVIEMQRGKVVAESRARINQVYFPHGGILSSVVELEDGWAIESGMIGNDGAFGAAQALDSKASLHKVVVQVSGFASVVDAEHLKAVALSSPDLLALLIKYEQFFLAQVQQTTACNAVHTVEQRTCKWLVRMCDLVGTELPVTQEFLAQMMGVRRTSVTSVASQLQKEGLISYSRGNISILDVNLLQRRACECHRTVRELYAVEFGDTERTALPFRPSTCR